MIPESDNLKILLQMIVKNSVGQHKPELAIHIPLAEGTDSLDTDIDC